MGGVEEDEFLDSIRRTICDARDHHATVTVTNEDHVVQILECKHAHDICDVHLQINIGAEQMPPLAEPRQRRAVDFVARLPQQPRYLLVAPTAVMATVHEYVSRHSFPSATLKRRAAGPAWATAPQRVGHSQIK